MKNLSVAIIGTGPAALMAAETALRASHSVSIFERRKSVGRKLLIAGSSGLNVSNELPLDRFISHYTPSGHPLIESSLKAFTPDDWIRFINELGIETFLGTSGRYFVKDMKAARFLKAWVDRLTQNGARFYFDRECTGYSIDRDKRIALEWAAPHDSNIDSLFDRVVFAIGGGSYDDDGASTRWPSIFEKHRVRVNPFLAANVGYQVSWSEALLKEAEGKPIKNAVFKSTKGERVGEAIITKYGIEGTPIYFVGTPGPLSIDLKPSLSREEILNRLNSVRENLSPIRRAKKQLALSEAALALLFHEGSREASSNLEKFVDQIKAFEITLGASQPLSEAISSSGGIALEELDENFMLKKTPGVYAIGEMLDWDAPTGGFLIQLCASMGHRLTF